MAKNTPPGPATDASGQTVIDPTKNVDKLVDLSVQRLDDLAAHSSKSTRREIAGLRREMKLHSFYEEKLAQKESERLDAIRQRDNEQVASAAAVQLNQQNTLAATVDRSAEAMRVAMAQQALTVATALDAKIAPMTSAIGDLQRFQFESGGAKAQTVESRTEQRSGSNLWAVWVGLGVALLFGAISSFIGFVGLAVAFYVASRPG